MSLLVPSLSKILQIESLSFPTPSIFKAPTIIILPSVIPKSVFDAVDALSVPEANVPSKLIALIPFRVVTVGVLAQISLNPLPDLSRISETSSSPPGGKIVINLEESDPSHHPIKEESLEGDHREGLPEKALDLLPAKKELLKELRNGIILHQMIHFDPLQHRFHHHSKY
jgi:hypothetical protein